MKKIFLFLITCTFVLQMKAQSTVPQYTSEDSIRVMNLLQSAEKDAAKDSTAGQTMLRIGRAIEKMNIPYVAHTLEPNDQERLIINLRELDCTTFVESAMALTLCVRSGRTTFDDYCRILQKIRYWQGRAPQYIRRLHYFTSWIEDNTTMIWLRNCRLPIRPSPLCRPCRHTI